MNEKIGISIIVLIILLYVLFSWVIVPVLDGCDAIKRKMKHRR